jgi:transposase InsO family protein
VKEFRFEFRIEKMCKVLEISRSGYFQWSKRGPSRRLLENIALFVRIKEVHALSHKTYGSPRITHALAKDGPIYNEKRVARIMKENGLRAKMSKKFKVTTDSSKTKTIFPNLLQQNFTADAPNCVWTSDITSVDTGEGWLYLTVVLDLFGRRVVGSEKSDNMRKETIAKAIQRAIDFRNPGPGVIFHSDKGSQYGSDLVVKLLKDNGFKQSMSGKGNCYDNAVTESFFHSLKTEWLAGCRFKTRKEAEVAIFEFIEMFYNPIRLHSSLRYMSPIQFEELYAKKVA